jgi:hypothetical protein
MDRISDFDLENLILWSHGKSKKEGHKSLHWFTENHKALVELRERRAAEKPVEHVCPICGYGHNIGNPCPPFPHYRKSHDAATGRENH